MRASFLEIYNENVRDLLAKDQTKTCALKETPEKGVYVDGLTTFVVKSAAEMHNILQVGKKNRSVGATLMNADSSRSHSIFTVTLRQQSRSGVSEKVVTSKLNLVDLAGSERLKKTMEGADGTAYDVDATMKKESMYINQSLTYLEQCVVGLSKRAPQHVAYRQTKLTGVLKDSLGGNCRTALVATLAADAEHARESAATLRFARRCGAVSRVDGMILTLRMH